MLLEPAASGKASEAVADSLSGSGQPLGSAGWVGWASPLHSDPDLDSFHPSFVHLRFLPRLALPQSPPSAAIAAAFAATAAFQVEVDPVDQLDTSAGSPQGSSVPPFLARHRPLSPHGPIIPPLPAPNRRVQQMLSQ